jgi:hypothetical protein
MTETARRAWLALAAAAALVPGAASAQLYKCKGADGKTVYSDTKCDASEKGALKVMPNSSTPSEREKAAAEAAAPAAKEGAPTASGAPPIAPASSSVTRQAGSAPEEYVLTYSDRERLRDLETTRASQGATAERKSAIELEMRSIRSGRDARLSSEERSRRDALHADLGSLDAPRRRRALSQFRTLYE